MTKKLVIIAMAAIVTSILAWFIWANYINKERFGPDGIAELGQNCDNKSCCNGTCIRVGGSRKCMYVLNTNQCGCNASDTVCVAGAKCRNNVCLAPRQRPNARISRMSMKECQRRFFPKKKNCDKTINETKAPLPRRIDYSAGFRRYDSVE